MTRISKSPEQYDAEADAPRDNRSVEAVLRKRPTADPDTRYRR